ncbi:hypothetical protein BH11PLA1_BH11PLA1_23610 [soil metagenome]
MRPTRAASLVLMTTALLSAAALSLAVPAQASCTRTAPVYPSQPQVEPRSPQQAEQQADQQAHQRAAAFLHRLGQTEAGRDLSQPEAPATTPAALAPSTSPAPAPALTPPRGASPTSVDPSDPVDLSDPTKRFIRSGVDDAVIRSAGATPSAQNTALANEITPALERSVTRGLASLASMQNADGSFGTGRFGRNAAVTSLACLAFMSDGHVPGRGKYAGVVEKGLENILACSNETGLIAGDSTSSPMYGHGFATLFLGEVYGMTPSGAETPTARRVHAALVKACRLIERTQNDEGGWRYNPVPADADISVTITQIMALRSARNAGIEVPKETIDRAVAYVRKCQNADGGFMYQLPAGVSLWPRSAAGVASLFYAGVHSDPAIDRGLRYIIDNALPGRPNQGEPHYWYGQYYCVQAMYLAGGASWATWWPAARRELLDRQVQNGTWTDPSVGSAYGTAMALIVLQMPKRYLPIFQK